MDIRLNLIPPREKEGILKKKRLKMVIRLEISASVFLVMFFGVLVSFRYILNTGLAADQRAQQQSEESSQYGQIKQYDQQFTKINAQVSQLTGIDREQLYWSRLLDKLDNLVFPGITLSSLTTNDYVVSMGGVADNRDDLVLLKEKLGSEKCFSNVDLPLSDLVDRNNVSFQINFDIQPSCLENK
ncbi:MAG: PilN domain-containing protein [Candidatus Pacebacteria bacterium]|nr:PilN domain-containing protein [Candidatus Paceibacterota bacterium]MDR3582971.1 PilN domain-containing protein [Candidatus Paceibacterota bacterium]